MSHLDDLILEGKKLVDARAAADAKAASEGARADKAEADLSAANSKIAELEAQIAADDQKAEAAAAELQAEVDRETSDTVSGAGEDTVTGGHGNDAIVSGEAEAHQG